MLRQTLRPEQVKQIRKACNMTQENFAHEVGVTFATVNRWENGKSEPKKMAIKLLQLFAKKHKVKLDD